MARSMILGVLILAVGFVAPAAGETLPGLSETTMLLDTLKDISKTHGINFKGMHKVGGGPLAWSMVKSKNACGTCSRPTTT